jgi:hypothetical protein
MRAGDLLPPSTNFTIPLSERVRALEGLPTHLLRKGLIERLTSAFVLELRALQHGGAAAALLRKKAESIDLGRVNDLIVKHNRYYPIEANLPIDPASGGSLDAGRVFRPLALLTIERLLAQL